LQYEFLFAGLPLTVNEGIYASIAEKLASGGLLYADAWDHKPPFIFLAYRLAGVFSDNVESQAHGLALTSHLANFILISFLVNKLGQNIRSAWLYASIYIFWLLTPAFQPWTGQADLLMQPFLLTAFYLALKRKRSFWFASGLVWAPAVPAYLVELVGSSYFLAAEIGTKRIYRKNPIG
jgi:hypothetical protein